MNLDADYVLTLLLEKRDIGDDAHRVADGIRDILHQLVGVLHADRLLCTILDSNVQSPALGVRVAAHPFEVLVVPRFLVLDVL